MKNHRSGRGRSGPARQGLNAHGRGRGSNPVNDHDEGQLVVTGYLEEERSTADVHVETSLQDPPLLENLQPDKKPVANDPFHNAILALNRENNDFRQKIQNLEKALEMEKTLRYYAEKNFRELMHERESFMIQHQQEKTKYEEDISKCKQKVRELIGHKIKLDEELKKMQQSSTASSNPQTEGTGAEEDETCLKSTRPSTAKHLETEKGQPSGEVKKKKKKRQKRKSEKAGEREQDSEGKEERVRETEERAPITEEKEDRAQDSGGNEQREQGFDGNEERSMGSRENKERVVLVGADGKELGAQGSDGNGNEKGAQGFEENELRALGDDGKEKRALGVHGKEQKAQDAFGYESAQPAVDVEAQLKLRSLFVARRGLSYHPIPGDRRRGRCFNRLCGKHPRHGRKLGMCQCCRGEGWTEIRLYCGKECQRSDWTDRHRKEHAESADALLPGF